MIYKCPFKIFGIYVIQILYGNFSVNRLFLVSKCLAILGQFPDLISYQIIPRNLKTRKTFTEYLRSKCSTCERSLQTYFEDFF